jgi:hypothetical protein
MPIGTTSPRERLKLAEAAFRAAVQDLKVGPKATQRSLDRLDEAVLWALSNG